MTSIEREEEERLVAEIAAAVREVQRAVRRGEPPAEWRARRAAIDKLNDQLRKLQTHQV